MGTKRAATTDSKKSSRTTVGTKAGASEAVEEAVVTTFMDLDVPTSKRLKAKHDSSEDQDEECDDTKDEEEAVAESSTKAAAAPAKPALTKKGSVTKSPLRAGAFTNTSMPDPLVLPKAPEGCIKITSWNVSGLNASLKKVN